MRKRLALKMAVPACILAALFSSPVFPQQRQPITMSSEGVKSRYVQQQVIDADDVPGHQVRVFEVHREFPAEKQLVVEGERVVESWVRGLRGKVRTRIARATYLRWSPAPSVALASW